ncbi:hypothetical protein [Hymenobacter sp. YC55]|uniref:hypothetical protein n=1 Tax=Hymenobacter sp. YC55 TaxID=3034019 RepID=UPI0023F78971|nr:hypothetical protein [Hymenobacter sp. YC55]MDF7815228.1 hypothetical protein [Hymenobacter sp. YC55]
MIPINSSLASAACVLTALSLGLGSCAVTPHPLTHSNERQDGTTMTYYNRQLNTRLQLYGDYDVELHPRNQADRVTKK